MDEKKRIYKELLLIAKGHKERCKNKECNISLHPIAHAASKILVRELTPQEYDDFT